MTQNINAAPAQLAQSQTAITAIAGPANAAAPLSFFARVQRLFGRRAPQLVIDACADIGTEVDDFLEYHNPLLSLKGYSSGQE